MKGRIWVLVFMTLALMLLGGYVTVFRVLQLNNRVKEYLVHRIADELHLEISVSSLSFSPWRIGFNDVSLKFTGIPARFEAKSIQLGFRFSRLLKTRFKPIPGTEELFLDQPRFIWMLADTDTTSSIFRMKHFPSLPLTKLPRFMININDGAIMASRDDGLLLMADRLSGWLDAREDSGNLRLEARVLSTEMNTTCEGSINRRENVLKAQLDIVECDLSRESLDILTGSILMESGSAALHVGVDQKREEMRLQGSFGITQAAFALKDTDIRLDSVSLRGRISEHDITLDSATGTYRGITPTLNGSMDFFPIPVLTVAANADSVDICEVFKVINPKMKDIPTGLARFEASASGPLANPVIHAKIVSREVSFRGYNARDINSELRIERGRLTIEKAAVTINDYRIQSGGTISGTRYGTKRQFTLTSSIRDMRDRNGAFSLHMEGETDSKTKTISARYGYSNEKEPSAPFGTFGGAVVKINDRVSFSCVNETLTMSGEVTDIFSRPRLSSHLATKAFPLHTLLNMDSTKFMLSGEFDIRGTVESAAVSGEFDLELGRKVSAHIGGRGVIDDPFGSGRKIKADARVTGIMVQHAPPMSLTLSARADSAGTAFYAHADDDQARLSLKLGGLDKRLSGTLKLANFPLEYIIGIFEEDTKNYHGKLTGTVLVSGDVTTPEFYMTEPIRADSLRLVGIEYLSGTGRVSGKPGKLSFDEFELRRKNITVAHADGIWTSGNPFILKAVGNDVDMRAIGDIISKERVCDGYADYSITMAFTRSNGTVDGTFAVKNGHFLDIPFDIASGVMKGGSQGFHVMDFHVEKRDVFTGSGSASSGYFWKDATINPGLKLDLNMSGKLTYAIPYIVPTVIKKADGDCTASVTFGGTWQEPVIVAGRLSLRHGMVEPTFLIKKVSDINATLSIDSEKTTPSGYKAVRLEEASGIVLNRKLTAENVFIGDPEWDRFKHPGLVHVINGGLGLDFGAFVGKLETGKGRDRSVELYIPGFMKPGETCRFEIEGQTRGEFVVGASPFGDKLTPYIGGTVKVLSGDLTYPLLVNPDQPIASDSSTLEEIVWNMKILAGSSVYYVSEFSKKVRESGYTLPYLNFRLPVAGAALARTAVKVDEGSVFTVTGRLADGSFRVVGQAKSSSGAVTYVGVEFEVETIQFDLDTARLEKPTFLTARAKTSVRDDSTGVDTEIYLKVNAVDRITGETRTALGRADAPSDSYTELSSELSLVINAEELGYLELEFSSSNPADTTRDRILSRLGLTPDRFGSAATRALAFGVDNYYLDFVRPLEHAIRKYSRLDVVRFTPSVLGNLVRSKLVFLDRFGPDTDYMLFEGSRVMLGEYFLDSFFFSYRGQYGVGRDFLRRKERGFYHEIGLQYLMKKNIRFQMNYDYDDIIKESDKRIEIRHDFQF